MAESLATLNTSAGYWDPIKSTIRIRLGQARIRKIFDNASAAPPTLVIRIATYRQIFATMDMTRLFAPILMLCLAVVPLPGCKTNPATGQTQFNALSQSQEIKIGDQTEPKFLKSYGGPIPDPEVVNYVQHLGQRLAAVSERPKLPWRFHAVDSKHINAFSLPGGKIFVTRGLLQRLNNEAQLAGVLGHEIGHVAAEHIGQQMTRQMAVSLGISALGIAGQVSDKTWIQALGAGAAVGSNLYLLRFSRSEETQADELGVRYMTRLGYNPIAQVQVMQILKKSGGNGGIEMLQTHPLPQTRIDDLEKLIQKKYPDYNNSAKYRFDQQSYHRNVLDHLNKLPPAKNMPKVPG